MRSVQEQCVQRIEAVQKEKDEAVKRFEEEKKKMEEEAASLQAGFSRQREKMEEENGHEMQHLIAQFEQQRTELIASIEEERKQLKEERDGVVNNAEEYVKKDLEKTKATADADRAAKLEEMKKALDNTHSTVLALLEKEQAEKLTQLEAAAKQQIEQLREDCKRRVSEQRKELEEKQAAIPDFSANSIDLATGLPVPTTPVQPLMDEDFGDLGKFVVSIAKVTIASKQGEKEAEKIQALELVRAEGRGDA